MKNKLLNKIEGIISSNILSAVITLLFILLSINNEYAQVISVCLIAKEAYGVAHLIMNKAHITNNAMIHNKATIEILFTVISIIVLVTYMVFWYMTTILYNVITIGFVLIIIVNIFLNHYQYKDISRNNFKKLNEAKALWIRRIVRSVFVSILIIIVYVVAGGSIPYIFQPTISSEYENQFDISQYITGNENGGERVRLVVNNEDALAQRLRLIDMAKDSIILSTFEFRADASGLDVTAKLYEAADRGVDIKILVDGLSGCTRMDGEPMFEVLASLPNVEIKIYNPVNVLKPWNGICRMHDKYMIVDNYGYLLGGRNTFNLFLGSYNSGYKNQDLEVFVWNKEDKASASINGLKLYFEEVWELPYCEAFRCPTNYLDSKKASQSIEKLLEINEENNLNYKEYYETQDEDENTYAAGAIKLISNPTYRTIKEPRVWNTLINLMKNANNRVYLHTPYVICNEYMYSDLKSIGNKSITAHLVLNAPEIGANPFGCSDFLREKSNVLETGFKVYEYLGKGSYHAKAVLIDNNISIIGSFNLDMRSTYLDTELMLCIESKELNEELSSIMENIENQCKHTISVEEYELPDGINNRTLDDAQKNKYKLIMFVTKYFRYLL